MTYEGNVVVDAVAHAYDTRLENARNERGEEFIDGMFDRHVNVYAKSPEYAMSKDQFHRRTSAEDLENVTFEESCVDFAIYHTVELTGFFEDGLIPADVGRKFREQNPGRVALYGFVDPLADGWEREMEYQVEELDVDGIKLYPSRYVDGEHLRMSLQDPETGRAVLEKAEALGVENVGVHKLLPLVNAPVSHFKLDDFDEAVTAFPDITFELVHAGFSFLEESVFSLSRHDNVYANFESTSGLLHAQPRQFARIMGEILKWAGPEKICMASGTMIHPQSLIESFWEFQIPADMREDYGYPKITPEMKEMILGRNALALHDIDPSDVPVNDAESRPGPWSHYT